MKWNKQAERSLGSAQSTFDEDSTEIKHKKKLLSERYAKP